jgi:hypothetical protein
MNHSYREEKCKWANQTTITVNYGRAINIEGTQYVGRTYIMGPETTKILEI